MADKLSPKDQKKWLNKHKRKLPPELKINDLYAVEQYGLTDGQETEFAMPDAQGVAKDFEEPEGGGHDDDRTESEQEYDELLEAQNYRQDILKYKRLLKDDGDKVIPEKKEEWEWRLEDARYFKGILFPRKRTKKQAARQKARLVALWKKWDAEFREFKQIIILQAKVTTAELRWRKYRNRYRQLNETQLAKKMGISQPRVYQLKKSYTEKIERAGREIGGGYTKPKFQFHYWLRTESSRETSTLPTI